MAILRTARSFSYKGTAKPDWLLINKTHRPLAPKFAGNFLKVPKRAGAYYFGKSLDMRTITFEITIMADDEQDLWKKAEWVADWLNADEPMDLIINDEPDRIYYAILMDDTELADIAAMGAGTLTFVCPDPYKYGQEYTQDILATPTILNDANAELFPTFEVTFTAPATHFAITNGEQTFLVGEPENVETTALERRQLINSYSLNSTVGWTASGTRIDGTIAGTMISDGSVFKATDYGAIATPVWHGPAMKTSISEELDNFRIDAFGYLTAGAINQLGKIELYAMDANGTIIAKMSMKDMHKDYENNWGEIRLGEYTDSFYMINGYAGRMGYFNNFSGMLTIERVNRRWFASVMKYDFAKKRYVRYMREWYFDVDGRFNQKLAQIQLSTLSYYTYPDVWSQSWDYVNVYKINSLTTETNILFKAGDILTIDNASKAVFINGEPRNDVLAINSDFISLKPGENALAMSPASGFTANAIYRKRWR